MDEYTLLLAAKLEADRRKLEREARVTAPQPQRAPSGKSGREAFRRNPLFRVFLAWR